MTFDPSPADELAEHVWNLLPSDLRVAALSVRRIAHTRAQAVVITR